MAKYSLSKMKIYLYSQAEKYTVCTLGPQLKGREEKLYEDSSHNKAFGCKQTSNSKISKTWSLFQWIKFHIKTWVVITGDRWNHCESHWQLPSHAQTQRCSLQLILGPSQMRMCSDVSNLKERIIKISQRNSFKAQVIQFSFVLHQMCSRRVYSASKDFPAYYSPLLSTHQSTPGKNFLPPHQ